MNTSTTASEINQLVARFIDRVSGARTMVIVSPDGLPMVISPDFERKAAERTAVVVTGLQALSNDAALCVDGGKVTSFMVEMQRGYLYITSLDDGSCIVLFVSNDEVVDLLLIAYAVDRIADHLEAVLTPELRAELMEGLP